MGDLLLKQKPPPLHHLPEWQNQEILSTKQFPPMLLKPSKKDLIRANEIHFRHNDASFRAKEISFRHSDGSFRSSDPSFKQNDSSFRHSDTPFRPTNQHSRHSDPPFKPSDHLHKAQDVHHSNSAQDHSKFLVPYTPSDSPSHDFQKWRETAYYPTPVISYAPSKPHGEHYFLAPYYRNVMPPPPNLHKSQRLLMVDSRRRYSMSMGPGHSSCHCRSKSMEDVRTEVVEIREDRWPSTHGKGETKETRHIRGSRRIGDNRRSVENLVTVEVGYPNSPPLASHRNSRKVGRLQVFQTLKLFSILPFICFCYFKTCSDINEKRSVRLEQFPF